MYFKKSYLCSQDVEVRVCLRRRARLKLWEGKWKMEKCCRHSEGSDPMAWVWGVLFLPLVQSVGTKII